MTEVINKIWQGQKYSGKTNVRMHNNIQPVHVSFPSHEAHDPDGILL